MAPERLLALAKLFENGTPTAEQIAKDKFWRGSVYTLAETMLPGLRDFTVNTPDGLTLEQRCLLRAERFLELCNKKYPLRAAKRKQTKEK